MDGWMTTCTTRCVYVRKAKPWTWNSKFELDCMKFSPQTQDFTLGTEKLFILLLLMPWTVQFAMKSIKNCYKSKGARKLTVTVNQSKWERPRDPDRHCIDVALGKQLERASQFWLDDSGNTRWKDTMAACSVAVEMTAIQHPDVRVLQEGPSFCLTE